MKPVVLPPNHSFERARPVRRGSLRSARLVGRAAQLRIRYVAPSIFAKGCIRFPGFQRLRFFSAAVSVNAVSVSGRRFGEAQSLPRWQWASGCRSRGRALLAVGLRAVSGGVGAQHNNSLNRTRYSPRSPSAPKAAARRLAQIR